MNNPCLPTNFDNAMKQQIQSLITKGYNNKNGNLNLDRALQEYALAYNTQYNCNGQKRAPTQVAPTHVAVATSDTDTETVVEKMCYKSKSLKNISLSIKFALFCFYLTCITINIVSLWYISALTEQKKENKKQIVSGITVCSVIGIILALATLFSILLCPRISNLSIVYLVGHYIISLINFILFLMIF
jgi:hypothetical protein